MAHPRVFISSTFYDLRQIRADLERFINGFGYEAVLHESGGVPYGSEEKLEEYCYKEIGGVDILLSIIGGRYGSRSQYEPYSISQMELKHAHDLNKQIYIFVETNVLSEYKTYLPNRSLSGFKCVHVDDSRIYKFIEEVESLSRNNPMTAFDTSQDITQFLTDQWAGLFQRFLQEQSRAKEVRLIQSLQETSKTLDKLVTFLTQDKKNTSSAIQQILLNTHPVFYRLRAFVSCPYPVFFTTRQEMTAWLNARSYTAFPNGVGPEEVWRTKPLNSQIQELTISDQIFDEADRLKTFTSAEWKDEWVTQVTKDFQQTQDNFLEGITDDDVPF